MKKGVLMGGIVMLLTAGAASAKLGGGDIIFSVSGAADVFFSHDSHAGRTKIGCTECHYAVFTTRARHRSVSMAEMREGKSCGTCHNGARAFNVADPQHCAKCHAR